MEETIQGRKLFAEIRYLIFTLNDADTINSLVKKNIYNPIKRK